MIGQIISTERGKTLQLLLQWLHSKYYFKACTCKTVYNIYSDWNTGFLVLVERL